MNQESQQQKKVLFIITKATWGGAQRYVFDLARSLPISQYMPVVAYGTPGRLSEELEKIKIRTHTLTSLMRDILPGTDIIGVFEILKCIQQEQPDIVHLNSSKAGLLGVLAARMAGTPHIIFTVHGWPFKERRSSLMYFVLYFLSWLTAYLAHTVIVVSKTDVELGEQMWQMGTKIKYIPIGIETPAYLEKEEALKVLWTLISPEKVPLEATRIVTIAELTPNKGVQFAIEAMSDLRHDASEHYVYLVIGEGEERASLEKLARLHLLDDKIFFLGFIPNAATLMRAFDVFLLPSIKEGMPYVLLEAGESGIPIVATDVVNPELKERYTNTRIIRSGNGFAIADAMRYVRQNTRNFTQTSSVPKFPLSTMIEQTLELYSQK